MARFSTIFGLSNNQAGLDFVDIDVDTDTPLYLDPYAIEIRADDWSNLCGDHIRSFFNQVLDALRAGDHARTNQLLNRLHEPNETRLGVSSGRPQGRGVGHSKASDLAKALVSSKAFKTGVLTDIAEAELFIRGVGPDTISDLTTNILRGPLARYTQEQCELFNIPTHPAGSIGAIWNIQTGLWESQPLTLPIRGNRPILLVPKFSVRQRLSLDSQEFWNHHMIDFLQQEYQNAGGALVHVLKSGKRKSLQEGGKRTSPARKGRSRRFCQTAPRDT